MSYYEAIDGYITLYDNVDTDCVISLLNDLNQICDWADIDSTDDQSISFNGYDNHKADDIRDYLEEKNNIALVRYGEVYIDGEESTDYWRMRKIDGENHWRFEYGEMTIKYEGDDVPLYHEETVRQSDGITIDATALDNIL